MVPRRGLRYALVIAATVFVGAAQLGLGPPESVPPGIPSAEGRVQWWATTPTDEPVLYQSLEPRGWDPDATWSGEGRATVWVDIPGHGRLTGTLPLRMETGLNTRNLDELRGPIQLQVSATSWSPAELWQQIPAPPLGEEDWVSMALVLSELGTAPRRIGAETEGSLRLDLRSGEQHSSGEGRLRVVRLGVNALELSSIGGIGIALEEFFGPELSGVWQQWQGEGGVPGLDISFELQLTAD